MATGLFMLQSQVSVTVTREEYHQQVLGRYPITDAGYRTSAELAWCTIGAGKYRGQRAVEVRLGGERVGELTYAMSQRYGAMLEQVTGRGYRPGCEAYVFLGKRGVEIELRLPRENSEIVFPVRVPPQVGGAPAAAGVSSAAKNGVRKPALIAAGVVGAFLVIGLIGVRGMILRPLAVGRLRTSVLRAVQLARALWLRRRSPRLLRPRPQRLRLRRRRMFLRRRLLR
jgi:hypothetical protein